MAFIHNIQTALPAGNFKQDTFAKIQKYLIRDNRLHRVIDGIYKDSGITKRHSVVIKPDMEFHSPFYSINHHGSPREPSTQERNALFTSASSQLGPEAAGRALHSTNFKPQEITHLVTVSCTGFSNPGFDFSIIKALGLSPHIERYHLGFMGCYAAFPALRMADQFCRAHPEAVVLVVCVELCSLHFQFKEDMDTILANSLFSDGAAAVVVSGQPERSLTPPLNIHSFSSHLIADGSQEMTWTIGNHGFDIGLSKYVPRIIGENIGQMVQEILQKNELKQADIKAWAIHPGGKSILDKFQKSVALEPDQMAISRRILSQYGNMSAATILFILKALMEEPDSLKNGHIFAAAFGPGLTVESAIFSKGSPKTHTLPMNQKLRDPRFKRRYNEAHFTVSAPRYDLVTRILSFGQDAKWKQILVDALPKLTRPHCLDLACGTGDVTFLLAQKFPIGAITGLDITEAMLKVAQKRNPFRHVSWVQKEMFPLDFPDETFDVITGAYALRNTPDLKGTLLEIQRVLIPGGVAAFLDFSKPKNGLFQFFQHWILKIWGGLMGILFHGNPKIHGYIADSLKIYPHRDDLQRLFIETGFQRLKQRSFFMGTLELNILQKASVQKKHKLPPDQTAKETLALLK
jgi:ubiquinone/menaquinone biosynthesis methyltransferase